MKPLPALLWVCLLQLLLFLDSLFYSCSLLLDYDCHFSFLSPNFVSTTVDAVVERTRNCYTVPGTSKARLLCIVFINNDHTGFTTNLSSLLPHFGLVSDVPDF